MAHAAAITQGRSTALIVLTVCCRVTGERGRIQVQQYQPPICRGRMLCRMILRFCRMHPVFLMLPLMLMAPSRSKMSMACQHTLVVLNVGFPEPGIV